MKTNRHILALLLLSTALAGASRELSIKKFQEVPMDLSARQPETARIDKVGIRCALVRVELPVRSAVFEGSILGDIPYKGNEHWVYVPGGTKHLSVRLDGFDTLELDFTNVAGADGTKSGVVYRVAIGGYDAASTSVSPAVAQTEPTVNTLNLNIFPANSSLKVDNTPYPIVNGFATLSLPYGWHTYSVSAPGYQNQDGSIEITRGTPVTRSIRLQAEKVAGTYSDNKSTAAPVVANTTAESSSWQLYLAPGFSYGPTSQVAVSVGTMFTPGNHNYGLSLEGEYRYSLAKSEGLYWNNATESRPSQYSTYAPSLIAGAKLGWSYFSKHFAITPQLGARFIKLKENSPSATYVNGAYCISATAGIRLEYKLAKHFAIGVTPEYALPIQKSPGYKMLTDISSAIANFNNSYSVTAALIFRF